MGLAHYRLHLCLQSLGGHPWHFPIVSSPLDLSRSTSPTVRQGGLNRSGSAVIASSMQLYYSNAWRNSFYLLELC